MEDREGMWWSTKCEMMRSTLLDGTTCWVTGSMEMQVSLGSESSAKMGRIFWTEGWEESLMFRASIIPCAESTAVRERTCRAIKKERRPVPQPISRTSRVLGLDLRDGTLARMTSRARADALWTSGF